jgi:hypothetical protein
LKLSKSTTCFFGLLALLAISSPLFANEPPDVAKVMDGLEAAVGAVRTCDVVLEVDYRVLFTVDAKGMVQEPQGGRATDPLHFDYHQIFYKSNRRLETLDARGTVKDICVQDGKTCRVYHVAQHLGGIQRLKSNDILPFADYSQLFKNLNGIDMFYLFRERRTTRVTGRLGTSTGDVGLECGPEPDAEVSFRDLGLYVMADKAHGLMPRKLGFVWTVKGKGTARTETVITEYVKTRDGTWVPIKAKTTTYWLGEGKQFGKPMTESVMSVDVKKSRWNEKLRTNTFTLPFPGGTTVIDEVRNITFVTEEAPIE